MVLIMEIFGFVCALVIMLVWSGGFLFLFAFDGAFGKRDIALPWMGFVFCLICTGWYKLYLAAPFSVVVN
jgi:hypothetical protein